MKMFLFAPNCFFFNSLFLAKKNILKCDKHVEPILIEFQTEHRRSC